MSWTLEIEIEWPADPMTAPEFERLLREVVDPLERDNIPVSEVRLVRREEL